MDESMVAQWAARSREGDETSFRRLVETLSRTLIAMAYRYTGDWEWARDLTQDTWIRVHAQIRSYDPARSFVAWLYAVHRNGCLDHTRRPWTRREATDLDGTDLALTVASPDDPAADLERREFRERVWAATRELSERQRAALVAVDLEDRPREEVARDLGMRPGTLRTTLHLARRKLAGLLRTNEEET